MVIDRLVAEGEAQESCEESKCGNSCKQAGNAVPNDSRQRTAGERPNYLANAADDRKAGVKHVLDDTAGRINLGISR